MLTDHSIFRLFLVSTIFIAMHRYDVCDCCVYDTINDKIKVTHGLC